MKAIIGSWDNRPYRLLAELSALRARVADLQAELDQARAENDALRAAAERDTAREVAVAEVEQDREIALTH
jgi:regulator of replication initiation timing